MESCWKINTHHLTDGQCDSLELPWTWLPFKYLMTIWGGNRSSHKIFIFPKRSFLNEKKKRTTSPLFLSQSSRCYLTNQFSIIIAHCIVVTYSEGTYWAETRQMMKLKASVRTKLFTILNSRRRPPLPCRSIYFSNARRDEGGAATPRSLTCKNCCSSSSAAGYTRQGWEKDHEPSETLNNVFNISFEMGRLRWRVAANLSLNYVRH